MPSNSVNVNGPLTTRMQGRILIGTLNNPPVNGLNRALRLALCELMQQANIDAAVDAVVILGSGRCFSAGADIRELGTPAAMQHPGLSAHLHPAIESCGKPVIAAVHGIAMGGGLETALACHFRVAHPDTRIATPEVRLGLIPLSGTQRLPRLVGLETTLQMIVGTREFTAAQIPGLFDVVLPANTSLEAEAVLFATRLAATNPEQHLVRNRPIADADPQAVIQRWLELPPAADSAAKQVTLQAIAGAIEAIAASFRESTFDAGLARAREIYDRLYQSPAVAVARAQFLSKRGQSR